jgi:hypothetical protein
VLASVAVDAESTESEGQSTKHSGGRRPASPRPVAGVRPRNLALAGRSDQLFADDAIVRLRLSGGIPGPSTTPRWPIDDACAKKAVAELTRQ